MRFGYGTSVMLVLCFVCVLISQHLLESLPFDKVGSYYRDWEKVQGVFWGACLLILRMNVVGN